MATSDRGFASMDPAKVKAIAAQGGRAAHRLGLAHEWTAAEAQLAGRKGGQQTQAARLRRQATSQQPVSDGRSPALQPHDALSTREQD